MEQKVVTFGEIMLRLSPPSYNTIEQCDSFLSTYGGGEANVAISLSCLGHQTEFVTKLPKNQLGDGALKHLRGYGVNVDNITREHQNMGIYFLETGFGMRPSQVIYNRRHSAINTIILEELNIDKIFKNCNWFHISGITLALSQNVLDAATYLIKCAKERGITTSFDFNYRSKLWSIDEAEMAIEKILPDIDIVFTSHFDATKIMKIIPSKKYLKEEFSSEREDVLQQLMKKYHIKYIFGTDRVIINAGENCLSAFCLSPTNSYYSKKYNFNIFDRVGGGDAFVSGVIHGLLQDFNGIEYATEFGLATSVLKHTIQGDACILKEKEIINFISSNGYEINR